MRLHRIMAGLVLVVLAGSATPAAARTPRHDPGGSGAHPRICLVCAKHARPDFNGDGYADLAIGSEMEAFVLYGSATGAGGSKRQVVNELTPGIPGSWSTFSWFGLELAWGDIDGDGFDDLAIGAPGDSKPDDFRGAVLVVYGGPKGLTTTGAQRFQLATPGVPGGPTYDNHFGGSLAIGDFDRDGHADLAIGWHSGTNASDSVDVLRGTSNGVTTVGAQRWWAGRPNVPGVAKGSDGFGDALAAADFNDDGYPDLAIGVPGANLPRSTTAAGAVTVLLGSAGGLTTAGSQIYQPATNGIGGHPGVVGDFGATLAAGDFDGDGVGDLAVGAQDEQAGSDPADFSGAVHVLYGRARTATRAGGLRRTGDLVIDRLTAGLAAPATTQDLGSALAATDLDKNGTADLLIGSGRDSVGAVAETGTVRVLYGFPGTGITTFGSEVISEATAGIPGAPTTGDWFGRFIGVGDFDHDGHGDVAIAAKAGDNGSVIILQGDVPLSGVGAKLWTAISTGLNGDHTLRSFGWVMAH